MKNSHSGFLLLVFTLSILGVNKAPAVTLRQMAAACGIKYGTCDGPRSDAPFAALMARESNVITAQNCLKFASTQPQQNQFSFSTSDGLAQFCQQHNIEFRGHVLIWHEALPSWVSDGSFNRQQMLAIMKNHITTVVGRYQGQIKEWDVVNEGIDVFIARQ